MQLTKRVKINVMDFWGKNLFVGVFYFIRKESTFPTRLNMRKMKKEFCETKGKRFIEEEEKRNSGKRQ